jgi:hypothetical protein
MCYEFSSWSWKLRAKQNEKAKLRTDSNESKVVPAQPVKRPEVKESEKVPA